MIEDPASNEFSTSSFTMEYGEVITCPLHTDRMVSELNFSIACRDSEDIINPLTFQILQQLT
jgi:hypothetical protein